MQDIQVDQVQNSNSLPYREGLYKVSPDQKMPQEGLWTNLFSEVDYFKNVKLGVLKGTAMESEKFKLKLGFEAQGAKGNEIASFSGKLTLVFQKRENQWTITNWHGKDMKWRKGKPFFREVLREAIPDDDEYIRARRSIHTEYIRSLILTGGLNFRYPKHYLGVYHKLGFP